jgi:23S rRNA G2069 N7-methylase RlmK/C1962 C5-methylase RlmI
LNQFPTDSHTIVAADAFDFLLKEQEFDYDLVIIDPPAFAKKKKI